MGKINEVVKQRVLELAANGRMTCGQAMELANAAGVPPIVVGQAAEAAGVKITACQLGCFGAKKGE